MNTTGVPDSLPALSAQICVPSREVMNRPECDIDDELSNLGNMGFRRSDVPAHPGLIYVALLPTPLVRVWGSTVSGSC